MMEAALALFVGILGALGVRLLMTRSLVKIVLGLVVLGNAVNVLLFTVAGLPRTGGTPTAVSSDPVVQAIILTSIVIGFGLQAFALVLVYRVFSVSGSADPDALDQSESRPSLEKEG